MKRLCAIQDIYLAMALCIPVIHSVEGAETSPSVVCPDKGAAEAQEDCPWAGITRAILTGEKESKSATPILQSLAPRLVRDIKADAKHPRAKALWGTSINYDEYAKTRILEPILVKTLSRLFLGTVIENVEEKQLVHAGMEHTYGYLFSNVKTPFGFKRARWVSGQIEAGFDLPKGTLGPEPAEGTLFSNVTYFAGTIAFRNEHRMLAVLNAEKKAGWEISPAITNFDYRKLSHLRIEEKADVPAGGGKSRTVTVRTDLVPFLKKKEGPVNTHLLVYSVVDPLQAAPQLITAFPVQTDFVRRKTDAGVLGDSVPVSTQYNGYVAGLSDHPRNGSRKLIEDRK